MSRPAGRERFGLRELSAAAIANARLLVVACAGLLALAAFAWAKMPRTETPRVEPTEAIVTLEFPGASPEEVEADVLPRVEEALYATEGVQWVESVALPNGAWFHVKLEAGTRMDAAFERLRGRVQATKRDLPAAVRDVDVLRLSTDLTPSLLLAVVGTRADGVLSAAARTLKKELASIDGVAGIDLWGQADPAIRVRVDTQKLREHGLDIGDVAARLEAAGVRVPAGTLAVGSLDALVQVRGGVSDVDSVARTPVATVRDPGGLTRVVELRDVAAVTAGARTIERRFFYDGEPAVALEIRFRPGEDAMRVGRRVLAVVERPRALPAGTRVVVAHDRQRWIRSALSTFFDSLEQGIVLVMAIVALGMGLRASLVVAAILPLSMAGALLGLYLTGLGLQQITLAGLTVSLGLLVDDAIVVTESIALMRHKGLSAFRAAVYGTARVFWANNGTTAVACAAFVPLFFMTGTIGDFVRGLPTAVIFALVTSLLVAQLVTPLIATRLLRRPAGVAPIADAVAFDRTADVAEAHAGWLFAPFHRMYAWVAPRSVRRPWSVIALSSLILVLSLALFPRIGFQFFPKADRPALFVTVELPRGTRLNETAAKVREVMARMRSDPDVLDVSAVAGQGYPEIFYGGRLSHRPSRDFGDILVRTRAIGDTAGVAARLRARARQVVGANVQVEELWTGPYVPHPVNIRIAGGTYAELRRDADEIEAELRAVPGAIHVTDNMADAVPIVRVDVDPTRAGSVHTTPAAVAQTLRRLYGEDKLFELHRGDDEVQVLLEHAPGAAPAVADLANVAVRNELGRFVPVRAAGEVTLTRGAAELMHRNNERVVQIYADVDGTTLPSAIIERMQPVLARTAAARGFRYVCAGAAEETSDSFEKLGIATIVALLIIFVLLMAMFRSFTLSFAVIAAVPFGLSGALVGLFVTGHPFGFMAFLGLIALLSVYVNHKIYFVDRFRQLTGRGLGVEAAAVQAGRDRVRPVVLTALTAVLGLLPLALGGGPLWTAFGWVNVFGLLASIPLSLVLLPALIVVGTRVRAALLGRPGRAAETHALGAVPPVGNVRSLPRSTS